MLQDTGGISAVRLATVLGSHEIPLSTIQSMLRHSKPQTTARGFYAVNGRQYVRMGLAPTRRSPITNRFAGKSV